MLSVSSTDHGGEAASLHSRRRAVDEPGERSVDRVGEIAVLDTAATSVELVQ